MPAPAHLFACLKWGVLLITSLRDTVNRLDSSSVLSQQMSVELNWSVKSIPEGLCQHIIKRSNRVVVLVVLFVLFRFCGSVLCIFCSVEVDLFLFIQLRLRKLISVLLMKICRWQFQQREWLPRKFPTIQISRLSCYAKFKMLRYTYVLFGQFTLVLDLS